MFNVNQIAKSWAKFAEVAQLHRPSNQTEYQNMLELIEHLEDIAGNLESPMNPYYPLYDLATTYVADYEDEHEPTIPDANPKDILEFLMEEHQISQKDLERAGVADQPLVSNILKGERNISKALAKRLGDFFHVSPAVFW